MQSMTNKPNIRLGDNIHAEVADSDLDHVSGGVVNIKFEFPGMIFRVGRDANGTTFINVKTDTHGTTFRGND